MLNVYYLFEGCKLDKLLNNLTTLIQILDSYNQLDNLLIVLPRNNRIFYESAFFDGKLMSNSMYERKSTYSRFSVNN